MIKINLTVILQCFASLKSKKPRIKIVTINRIILPNKRQAKSK